MKRSWLSSIGPAFVLAIVASAHAAEPYDQFVQGLRDREYYDFALLYLDNLENRADVPDEIRQAIPFEKATTLQQSARSTRNLDVKTEQLSQAEALLEQFVKANPLHPRAGQANSERARILLGRAEVETLKARSPSNSSKKAEFQANARKLITEARGVFQAAHDQFLAKWKSFSTFIDERDDPVAFRARRKAEIAYIRSQLDLALCTYAESQTYDKKAPEYAKFLTKAALEFEDVHTKYRSLVAGLYARMWQGKCFEEQDEIRKALGVYNELLQHGKTAPGETPKPISRTMKDLQDKVLQFRLICLNHEQRKDYKVVVQEATDWIAKVRGKKPRNKVGLAIMWERARSRESLGTVRTETESERNKYLTVALADARYINRWPGEYKDVSAAMIQRVLVLLKRDTEDPKDFETAFGLGRSLVKQIKGFNDEISDPKNKAKVKALRVERTDHLDETIRILNLALTLAGDTTELKQLNHARYLLSYVYYLTRQSYEAAILGEFVGLHFDKENAQMGLDSAYLAMAAYVQAHNEVAKGQSKDFEMRQMARLANMITTNWPESDRANEARMTLGRIYGQLKKPVEGAEWYSKVPTTAPQYTSAQLAAGQSYWTAYLESAPKPDTDPTKPAVEELQKWQDASLKHLDTGITKAKTQLPEKATGTEEIFAEYIAAKVSRAQIYINKGEDQKAVDLLTGDPHPVMKAIIVPEGTKRAAEGIKSQQFAGLSYQLLLRGYVGTQKIDLALKAMEELESLSPDAEGVMQIYVQLGRELEKEIERLQKLGLTERLSSVRTSFDQFLNELYSRKDSMTAGSLIWIAETYYGLAKGLNDDPAAATAYFEKAATTYQEIINGAATKGANWLETGRVVGVKLRLVNCRRRQGEFETAKKLITEVLTDKPSALDAQFEGAYVLQDWADSGQGDSWKRFIDAINGAELVKGKVKLWGWGGAALRLQRRMDAGVSTPAQDAKMYEARYNSIWCRHRFAQAQTSTPKRQESLASARREIETFVAISADVDEQWQEKYNTIYTEVLQSMVDAGMKDAEGNPVVVADIVWPAAEIAKPKPGPGTTEDPEIPDERGTPPPPPPPAGTNPFAVIFGVLVLIGFGVGVYFMMTKKSAPKRVAVYADIAPVLPPQGTKPARRKRVAGKPQAGKPASSKKSAAGKKPATAKKRAPAKKAGEKPTRPRPKPPQA
ncbi:MAG: tetratricopeptide repeat protein [Planctomycetaceae bacterium]|nr:tetratricopeptide repeat protein [Planctomycetaceae bacterium]